MQETRVWSLGRKDPLEKGMANHSSIIAWRIPWTEEPDGLQSVGLQRFRHDWVTNTHILILQQGKNPSGNVTVGNKSLAALFQAMCLTPTPTCHSCLTSVHGPEQMWAQAENVESILLSSRGFNIPGVALTTTREEHLGSRSPGHQLGHCVWVLGFEGSGVVQGEHQHASQLLLKGAGPSCSLLQDQLCLQNTDTSMLRDTEKGFMPQETGWPWKPCSFSGQYGVRRAICSPIHSEINCLVRARWWKASPQKMNGPPSSHDLGSCLMPLGISRLPETGHSVNAPGCVWHAWVWLSNFV